MPSSISSPTFRYRGGCTAEGLRTNSLGVFVSGLSWSKEFGA
jgi:type IV secretory pathway TrbF-like protein